VVVDLDPGRAAYAHFAHLPRNQGRVRRHAAARGENPFSGDHAAQIFRRRFDAGEHDFFSVIHTRDSLFRAEHDMAARRARSSSQTGPNFLRVLYCLAIKNWRQEMRERIGRNTTHRVLFGYQFFADHLHGDTHRRMAGAFAVSGLQNVEAIILDREFEVLHVLEVPFKDAANVHKSLVRGGHFFRQIGDRMRRAHASDHVFTLRVDEVFAVENFFAGGRVARECHSRRAGVAHISEHHRLNVHCCSPLVRDAVLPSINDGAVVHP
jgi:hypothetical protein